MADRLTEILRGYRRTNCLLCIGKTEDIEWLVGQLNNCRVELSHAKTEQRLFAIPKTHVPTNDDTIAITITPSTHFPARSLPVAPPVQPPDIDIDRPFEEVVRQLSDTEIHNNAVDKCAAAVTRAFAEAARNRLDLHGLRRIVETAVEYCRKPV